MKNLIQSSNSGVSFDSSPSNAPDGDVSATLFGQASRTVRLFGSYTPERILEMLTSREKQILHFIADGYANKQAAAELQISIKTVEKHRQNLSDKLGIHGTAALTRYAVFAGVVDLNPLAA